MFTLHLILKTDEIYFTLMKQMGMAGFSKYHRGVGGNPNPFMY